MFYPLTVLFIKIVEVDKIVEENTAEYIKSKTNETNPGLKQSLIPEDPVKIDAKIDAQVKDTIAEEYDPKDGMPSHPVAWQAIKHAPTGIWIVD